MQQSFRTPRRRTIVGLTIAVLVLIAVSVGLAVYASRRSSATVCDVRSVASNVLPSVVTISANGATSGGTGSGVVIRSGGYILTNNHVISVAAHGGSVEVLFSDGTSVPATITGRDVQSDLAVLHVDPPFSLPVIKIGESSSVYVGQPVVALGAPLGLSGTVTSGIVSALDRTVRAPADNGATALLTAAVQTDASINPGNSGGALVDCGDQLVGVPTAGATVPGSRGGSIGLGFAIPVDFAMKIADELIDQGSVAHASFGLEAVPIPPSAAAATGTPRGLFVRSVTPGGPAGDAGIQRGDVITKIDGADATNGLQLENLTLTKKPGDTVAITYWRGGKTTEATITLGSAP